MRASVEVVFKPITAGFLLAAALLPVSSADPTDVVLHEDFEGPATRMDEILAKAKISSSITTEVAFSGSRSLRMDNTKGGKFSRRLPLGGGWDELYARYMFRVGNAESRCWGYDEHYKLMGFEGGTEECKGGEYRSDGSDCFTVRTRFNYPNLGVRVESAPYPGVHDILQAKVKVADGEWHCLEMRVKLNTPGEKDGQVDVWVDGRQKTKKKLRFRKVGTLQIDKWWFTYWANDDWCGPLYVDDLTISEGPIGCPDSP